MIYGFIFAFAALLALNIQLSRSLLYPPSLFCAVWLLTLIGLAFSSLYRVSPETFMVFLVGAMAFSAGGMIFISRPKMLPMPGARFLDLFLLIAVVALPFFWMGIGDVDLALQRSTAVEAASSSERQFTLVANLVVFAYFLAIGLHISDKRWRAYLGILVALIYTSLTGSKGGLRLLLVLMFISSLRSGVTFKRTALTLGAFVVLFVGGLALVNLAYLGMDISKQTFILLGETVQSYWLGSLVAFEQVVQDPTSVESAHDPSRFFLETANGFGAHFDIPPIHLSYAQISQWQDTNTYTIYLTYFKDYGWAGVVIAMGALGAFTTWVYNEAHRNPIALAFFGVLCVSIVFSIQAEHFLLALNQHIKMLLFFAICYFRHRYSPVRIEQCRLMPRHKGLQHLRR